MIVRGKWLIAGLLVATAGLSGCRDNPDKADTSPLDQELVDADPAIKGALQDKIMVDPKLSGQANRNALGPGNSPVDGGVPAIPAGRATAAAEAAAAMKAGKLVKAPGALPFEENSGDTPKTIGALASQQSRVKCESPLSYDRAWAERLPAAFNVYPRATVREAAGVKDDKCNLRVVNFQTAASLQGVLDYYNTLAIRAGYDTDHRVRGEEHMLGGTNGDFAYVIFARRDGGMTDVDLIASGGR